MPSHKPAIYVAVDFDGTLSRSTYPDVGPEIPGAAFFLHALERLCDGKIGRILWTCREGDKLENALAWLDARGFGKSWWHSINDQPPSLMERFGTNPRKVGADVLVDDRAMGWPKKGSTQDHWAYWIRLLDHIRIRHDEVEAWKTLNNKE